MKRKSIIASLALGAILLTSLQARDERPEGPPPHRQGPPPLIQALDADGDGVISAEEIENATTALLGLDTDGDGALSEEELRPPRPDRGARDSEDSDGRRDRRDRR
ncbi:MAG: EF-hand domain-containing protein [Verrucomicrobiota bacterium]